ncbi:hypothetical protein [uncultured Shewanella sp.]|uniref:hypothetical protein n=1 Tax=uncultured Shewanella sp. TaxID=173975 RepID=UPI0026237117|nr:hypothetical protein [uncultured Shewanella sp.]
MSLISRSIYRAFFVLLLCLSFITQTMAGTMMSCEEMNMTETNMQTDMKMGMLTQALLMKDQSHHQAHNASASCGKDIVSGMNQGANQSAHQQCQQCHCVVAPCSSPVVTQQLHSHTPLLLLVARLSAVSVATSSPLNPTLYRPPIYLFV